MRALILGVTGQDGSYLAEQLLADGHDVWGLVRRTNAETPCRQVVGDLLDQDSLDRAISEVGPDVVFNLAAVTAPGGGWGTAQPPLLATVTGLGVLRLLDAMVKYAPESTLVHASSSAIYDLPRYGPYGAAKLFAHEAIVGYRNVLRCSNAVLFSHTSPRQDPRFLARRICAALVRESTNHPQRVPGLVKTTVAGWLRLTDLESRRDWGYAPDYMRALAAIADLEPGDYQICTGVTHSVRDLVEVAADAAGIEWEIGDTGPRVVPDEVNPDTHPVVPGWKPETTFEDMIRELVACS